MSPQGICPAIVTKPFDVAFLPGLIYKKMIVTNVNVALSGTRDMIMYLRYNYDIAAHNSNFKSSAYLLKKS